MVEELVENTYYISGVLITDSYYQYTEDNPKILSSLKEKTIERQTIKDETQMNKDALFNLI